MTARPPYPRPDRREVTVMQKIVIRPLGKLETPNLSCPRCA